MAVPMVIVIERCSHHLNLKDGENLLLRLFLFWLNFVCPNLQPFNNDFN